MSTTIGRFAFLKRTGLAKKELNLQDYQLLFPIPANEIMYSSTMTQNPGYKKNSLAVTFCDSMDL